MYIKYAELINKLLHAPTTETALVLEYSEVTQRYDSLCRAIYRCENDPEFKDAYSKEHLALLRKQGRAMYDYISALEQRCLSLNIPMGMIDIHDKLGAFAHISEPESATTDNCECDKHKKKKSPRPSEVNL